MLPPHPWSSWVYWEWRGSLVKYIPFRMSLAPSHCRMWWNSFSRVVFHWRWLASNYISNVFVRVTSMLQRIWLTDGFVHGGTDWSWCALNMHPEPVAWTFSPYYRTLKKKKCIFCACRHTLWCRICSERKWDWQLAVRVNYKVYGWAHNDRTQSHFKCLIWWLFYAGGLLEACYH